MAHKPEKESEEPARKQIDAPPSIEFSPSEFMRARRPALFSDSAVVGEVRLSREVFEYHLHTLTSRKQETEFEHFCRRLVEKELCPNILPQTGPTGGGDSKVDAETYPVADSVAMRWYEGLLGAASQERWAFAFSAKEDWRSKVQSDVKKIAETGRDYKLIYFVTNQFVRDKARATVEDALTKKYKIGVRILDRSWIVKSIFDNGRLQLAIETLNLTGYDEIARKVVGPRDLEREAALRELEEHIDDTSRYQGVEYQLAEDCLDAALIARALELPRVEVDGRFARAERIAEQVGHRQQRLRVFYNKAWTAFWWYDDFDELTSLYDRVEELASGSQQTNDLELLANLWTVLSTTIERGKLDPIGAKFNARTVALKAELERLAADEKRPNNSLWARTNLLLMELRSAIGDAEHLDRVFGELKQVVESIEGLTAYPIEPVAKIIREIGEFLPDSTQYDELFETIVSVTGSRVSEGEAGRVLSQRGFQKLRQGKTYDAIRLFGRAQQKLAMREYRGEFVTALVGCGLAYESAGLLWAARANILAAANQAFAEYWEHGELVPQTLTCLRKLIWIELQLGRVPCVLEWIEAASIIAQQLVLEGDRKKAFIEERIAQDRVLAILLLRTDLWESKWLDFLPELLDGLGLNYSWMALLYTLGHEDYLRAEGAIPESEDQEAIDTLFRQWVEQPAGSDLPGQPELLRESAVIFRSFVLGCEVIARVANNLPSIYLAESILGAMEALLATSLDADAFPHASEFNIIIEPSDVVTGIPEYEFDKASGEQIVHIKHSSGMFKQGPDEQSSFRDWLQEFVIQAVFRFTVVNDIESYAERLFGDELGLGRAFNFSDPAIPIGNILGDSPKLQLSDWEAGFTGNRFPLRRSEPWHNGLRQPTEEKPVNPPRLRPGQGKPPQELLELDKVKHKDRRVFSLINMPLWNSAGWAGTLYITFPELDHPPYMALGFRDAEAGQAIFQGWLNKLGRIDHDEQLRISIITGIDRARPASYKVIIGTSPDFADRDQSGRHFVMVSRINQMDPPDSRNLDGFLRRYERLHKYILLPAHFTDMTVQPTPFFKLGIGKQELLVRPAWQVGENDPDVSAIEEDDDPIIPDDVVDAPILSALQRFSDRGHATKARVRKNTIPPEVLKQYADAFGVHEPPALITAIEYLSKGEVKGHWSCYCGSGKKLRQCHLQTLREVRSQISPGEAKDAFNKLRGR